MPLSPSCKQLSTTGSPGIGPASARQLWGKAGREPRAHPGGFVLLVGLEEDDSCLSLQLLGHPSSCVGRMRTSGALG